MVSTLRALFAILLIFLAAPPAVLAQARGNIPDGSAMTLLSDLLFTFVPWVTGFVVDFLILRKSHKLFKTLATCVLAIVLSYPSVWFACSSLVIQGGSSAIAWVICALLLVSTIGAIKIVAYWVINEAFPARKVALLFFLSSTAMVAGTFVEMAVSPRS